ncbi:MAG: NAD(P)H-dependent oxidoreductase [Firmicutes bacterium]|nr:NAD(P)H-dependent oxidoreductase [Bacillota bacterium]
MNKIVAINGSPKLKYSASGILLSQVAAIMGIEFPVYQATKLVNQANDPEMTAIMSDILTADTLLIAFPLYIDALPAPLLKVCTLLEQAAANPAGKKLPRVYAIANCGFYEAENNRLALDMLKNFCRRSGLGWGYGIGIGAGGSVSSQSPNTFDGPLANVYAALSELVKTMANHSSPGQNLFLTPQIPRAEYLQGANKAWEQAADKYGQLASIRARPHEQ